jgi:hypothetical protein
LVLSKMGGSKVIRGVDCSLSMGWLVLCMHITT